MREQRMRRARVDGDRLSCSFAIVVEDRSADRNAFVADIGSRVIAGRRDQLSDGILPLMAEGTAQFRIRGVPAQGRSRQIQMAPPGIVSAEQNSTIAAIRYSLRKGPACNHLAPA